MYTKYLKELKEGEISHFEYSNLVYVFVLVTVQALFIAIKYATYNQVRWDLNINKRLSPNLISFDQGVSAIAEDKNEIPWIRLALTLE